MDSFFSCIQSYFEKSYGGRYFEIILKEVSKYEPRIVKILTGLNTGKYELVTEFRMDVGDRVRIADIAVLSEETMEPVHLIEVKYDDHKNLKNPAQLADYIAYSKVHNLGFTYLTQYYPPKDDLELLNKNNHKHLLFSELASNLDYNNEASNLTNLLIDYLRDKGLAMENIDQSAVYKLLVRLFNPIRGQRVHENEYMINKIPMAFHGLMTNMNVIAQELSQYLENSRKPTIDLKLWPAYTLQKNSLNEMCNNNDSYYYPEDKEKDGGTLFIFARSNLKRQTPSSFLYLEYGFCFEVEKGAGNNDFTCSLYADISGDKFPVDVTKYKKIGNSIISDKKKCIDYYRDLITQSRESALAHPANKHNSDIETSLKSF